MMLRVKVPRNGGVPKPHTAPWIKKRHVRSRISPCGGIFFIGWVLVSPGQNYAARASDYVGSKMRPSFGRDARGATLAFAARLWRPQKKKKKKKNKTIKIG